MAPMAALMIAETIPVPRWIPTLGSTVANECTDNPYYEIADKSESGPPHDLFGQPTGDKTNEQYDQKTFI